MQQVLTTEFNKTRRFVEYAINFLKRHNFAQEIMQQIVSMLKDMLSCRKKLKIAKYRLNYQMYKLQEMEKLIAENNNHNFLSGKKINHIR